VPRSRLDLPRRPRGAEDDHGLEDALDRLQVSPGKGIITINPSSSWGRRRRRFQTDSAGSALTGLDSHRDGLAAGHWTQWVRELAHMRCRPRSATREELVESATAPNYCS